MKNDKLSKQLQELVSWSVAILGEAITHEYGKVTFQRVENLRKKMKSIRAKSADKVYDSLETEHAIIKKYSDKEVRRICHSFSLMLELINRCEGAYRNFRLEKKEPTQIKDTPEAIIFVLTAHPTEARSPEFLELFKSIEGVLKQALTQDKEELKDVLFHSLLLALKISIARKAKPSVSDEAMNIYNYTLQDDILNSLIKLSEKGINVSFRTWVGGDKDGHPGIDETVMLSSLSLSRELLSNFLEKKLLNAKKVITYLKHEKHIILEKQFNNCLNSLRDLKDLRKFDGQRISIFRKDLEKLYKLYEKKFSVLHPELKGVKHILWTFPALVLPLEVREDSEVVAQAVKFKEDFAITRMLCKLAEISEGFEPKWYVRGFVLSMVQSSDDLLNGYKLCKKLLKGYKVPVVPLFENENALTHATEILDGVLSKISLIPKTHISKWGNKYEIMVGYSDSSKENGVISSRVMIAKALNQIENTLKKYALRSVFFHGSGGSIERGGGSLKEQISWWPNSALEVFKSTIQGEMVARNFSSSNIFEKQIYTICEYYENHKSKNCKQHKTTLKFVNLVRETYSKTIKDDDFLNVIHLATPYSFLHHLKIGSRPSKRANGSIQSSLRAIPWILCWTQTRTLFPTWWGVGSSWKFLNEKEREVLIKEFNKNPVLMAYVKALGFTLAKIDLGVWKLYLMNSDLDKEEALGVFRKFKKELKETKEFFSAVTSKKEFLWFRPWLQHSIDLRSTMIHPINICQIESLRRSDHDLLRTSVTGIACGMLTTG